MVSHNLYLWKLINCNNFVFKLFLQLKVLTRSMNLLDSNLPVWACMWKMTYESIRMDRMTLNVWSSFLCLPQCWITDTYHHFYFMQYCGSNTGLGVCLVHILGIHLHFPSSVYFLRQDLIMYSMLNLNSCCSTIYLRLLGVMAGHRESPVILAS